MVLTKLKQQRLKHEMTQEQLSARAGVSNKTVSKAENGSSVYQMTANALARALGVDTEDLA